MLMRVVPSCLPQVLFYKTWIFSFRPHPRGPAAPVLPGPHSSSYQGEGLPSHRLGLAVQGSIHPRPLAASPCRFVVPGAESVV